LRQSGTRSLCPTSRASRSTELGSHRQSRHSPRSTTRSHRRRRSGLWVGAKAAAAKDYGTRASGATAAGVAPTLALPAASMRAAAVARQRGLSDRMTVVCRGDDHRGGANLQCTSHVPSIYIAICSVVSIRSVPLCRRCHPCIMHYLQPPLSDLKSLLDGSHGVCWGG
jgi:hypothetical protein